MLCGSHIKIWNHTNHMKKIKKELRTLSFQLYLVFWCLLSCFFMWFARFQILICESQSIWRKLLVVSWLYCRVLLSFKISSSFFSKLQWLENSLLLQSIWKQELSIPEVLFANYNTHCYAVEMVCLYISMYVGMHIVY